MKNSPFFTINVTKMPTYIFKNTKTEEVFEVQMRISELDAYKQKNPDFSNSKSSIVFDNDTKAEEKIKLIQVILRFYGEPQIFFQIQDI